MFAKCDHFLLPGSLAEIDAETAVLDRASRADTTWKAYGYAWGRFEKFTIEYDLPSLPSDKNTVRRYLSYLSLTGRKTASANMAVAAIKAIHEMEGFDSPTDGRDVHRSLKFIKRVTGTPAKQAEPTTRAILRKLVDRNLGNGADKHAGSKDPHVSVWRNVWFEVMAFATLSRFNDLQQVTRKDVLVTSESVTLIFRQRKNDQSHLGHRATVYATSGRYCPVRLTRRYLARLPDHPDMPLLPAWGQGKKATGQKKHVPLNVITYDAMRARQKVIFDKAGLPGSLFSLHSGRVGGCHALEGRGWDVADIGAYGGWAPGSREPIKYCRRALRRKKLMFRAFYTMSK
jgi:hypothetical protein